MANDFYTHSSYPATGSQGSSALARAEFDAVMAGFDKMPALTGNAGKFVVVNSGASALSVASSISESAGNLSIAGSQLTIAPATITWSGNPTHSGNHTFSGAIVLNSTLTALGTATLNGVTYAGGGIAAGNYVLRALSTTGDRLRIASLAAGSGALIDVTDAGETTTAKILTLGSSNGTVNLGSSSQFSKDVNGRILINSAPSLGGVPLNVKTGTNRNIGFLDVSSVATLAGFTDAGVSGTLRLAGSTLNLSGNGGTTDHAVIDTSGNVTMGSGTSISSLNLQFILNKTVQSGIAVGHADGTFNNRMAMFADSTANLVGWDTSYSSAWSGYVWRNVGAELMRLNSTSLILNSKALTGVNNIGGYSDAGAYTIYGGSTPANGGYVQLYGGSNATPNLVIFGTNGAERGRFDANGNFGIGVAPTQVLEVARAQNAPTVVRTSNGNAGASAYAAYQAVSDTGTGVFATFSSTSGIPNQTWLYTGGAHPLILGTAGAERVHIDATGLVGIGTSPSARLSVDSGATGLMSTWNSTNANGGYTTWANSGTVVADVGTGAQIHSGGSATSFGINARTGSVVLSTAQTKRLEVTNAGLVDIIAGSGNLRIGGGITRFESAEQTCPTTSATTASVAHGGPRAPDQVQMLLRCKTAEAGYSVGDEVAVNVFNSGGDKTFSVWANSTNVGMVWRSDTNAAPYVGHKTTAVATTVTPANWRLVFKCIWL